ncbi:unnamed protein product [Medioppia subpectinata]|uniref:VWFC domain-containing protein n=1 Tax=Medioppia subpectinata TaxID=1979941 RepID=A0A7R9Q1V7_9ACAR|nr:unnamed protein product [Medioppia subpectinata]CAG2108838.1 unnamed protein product [Medioppia subpectinata]
MDNTGGQLLYPKAIPSSLSATSDRYFRGQRVASRRDRAFVTYEGDEYPPPTPDILPVGSRIPVQNPCRICECRDFGGRQYRRGKRIYPDEDYCKICHCDEHWDDNNPLNTLSCHRHQCELQLNRDFAAGCLPIYHEGSCCPIEYKCPQTSETCGVLSIYSGRDLKECWFDGRNYTVGQQLVTGNPCVSCECKAPPDFTCVQKSCPTPKHNCYVGKWDNSVCCQHYTCSPTLDYVRDESQFKPNFYSSQ